MVLAVIPLPRPIRSAPGDRRPTRDAFTYREPYELPRLSGFALLLAPLAVWWGIDYLAHVL